MTHLGIAATVAIAALLPRNPRRTQETEMTHRGVEFLMGAIQSDGSVGVSQQRLQTALTILAVPCALAQAPLAEWLFDADVGQWQVADPASQLTVTGDENVIREDDNAVAEYSYQAEIGTFSGIMTQVDVPLPGAETLSLWVRTTDRAIMLVSINEADGSNYMGGFFSLPDRWQEVALSLAEFRLDDDSADDDVHVGAL